MKRVKSIRRPFHRVSTILLCLFALLLIWGVILGIIVWQYGKEEGTGAADCIVVLGAAVQGKDPSPVFEERIRHGIDLYKTGRAENIIFTGGVGKGQLHSEASIARAYAIRQGIPPQDILIEESSRTTQENLAEARLLMRRHGLASSILVSDPLHMKRAMLMAGRLGIVAISSPTPTSRYRSFGTRLAFLLREVYFIHHYAITGH